MIYADYTFYTEQYLLGKEPIVTEGSFPFYARQSSMEIDCQTFGKAETLYDSDTSIRAALGCCCCELAELMYRHDKANTAIQSERVGDYSVTYREQSTLEYTAHIYAVIAKQLTATGLLYCGVI